MIDSSYLLGLASNCILLEYISYMVKKHVVSNGLCIITHFITSAVNTERMFCHDNNILVTSCVNGLPKEAHVID
jgi:hypothetical protein